MPSYKRYENERFVRLPDHPNYRRRAIKHDYKRPARYMLTLTIPTNRPKLATIIGNPAVKEASDPRSPKSILSQDGMLIQTALNEWLHKFPMICPDSFVVMPDHIHVCLDVKAYLENGLSRAIAGLMGKCTSLSGYDQFFEKGFNDKIAYTAEQWERQRAYVEDNPRRLLIKRLFPDYYRRRWGISVGGREYTAIGNIFLLKAPEMHVVRYSRRFAPGEFELRSAVWRRSVMNGGVLISPFIHPEEKRIRDFAVEEGGALIRVCENGFAERFAPQGEEFELMGAERLLLIGPAEHRSQRADLTYGRAQELNALSEEIAGIDWGKGEGRIRLLR